MENQAELQKKIEKELADKTEEAKKLKEENTKLQDEFNRAKGVVGQKANPNVRKEDIANPKFYEENIKKITERHDAYFQSLNSGKLPMIDKSLSGFAEMVNLQAKAGNLTADLSEEDAEEVRRYRYQDKSSSDIITPRLRAG